MPQRPSYLSGAKVMQPALMITAELDPVLRPQMAEGMSAWVPNLREYGLSARGGIRHRNSELLY